MTRRRRAEYTQEAPQVNAGNPRFRAEKGKIGSANRRVAPTKPAPYKRCPGEVPEWSIGTVSKTVVRASVPWVRIPPSPPVLRDSSLIDVSIQRPDSGAAFALRVAPSTRPDD